MALLETRLYTQREDTRVCERGRAVEAWHCIADQQMRERRRLQESAGMTYSLDKHSGIPSSVRMKPVKDTHPTLTA